MCRIHQLMIRYCQEAKQYGEVPHSAQKPFNKVLVLLNPAADKRSAAATVSFNYVSKFNKNLISVYLIHFSLNPIVRPFCISRGLRSMWLRPIRKDMHAVTLKNWIRFLMQFWLPGAMEQFQKQ